MKALPPSLHLELDCVVLVNVSQLLQNRDALVELRHLQPIIIIIDKSFNLVFRTLEE